MPRSVSWLAPKTRCLVLVLAALGGFACESGSEAAAQKSEKTLRRAPATVVLEARSVPKTLSYVGSLVAPRDATLSSTRGGVVDALFFEVGKSVLAGELLVKLGAAELSYASRAAVAGALQGRARIGHAKDPASLPSAQAAKVALELATDADARAAQLLAKGTLSQQDYTRVHSNLAAATAQYEGALAGAAAEFAAVQQLEAASQQANAALGDKSIRAPFAGVVLERFIEVGQMASPSAPLLRMIDPTELRVRFDVPQFDADKVRIGGKVTLQIGGRTLPATVVRSTPGLVGQANARLVEATIDVPNDAAPALRAQLLPGSLVPLWLEVGGVDDVVLVPVAATLSTAGLLRAWVLKDGHLSERLLSVLRFDGDLVLVRGGLEPGEQLVRTPAADFRVGEEVAP